MRESKEIVIVLLGNFFMKNICSFRYNNVVTGPEYMLTLSSISINSESSNEAVLVPFQPGLVKFISEFIRGRAVFPNSLLIC